MQQKSSKLERNGWTEIGGTAKTSFLDRNVKWQTAGRMYGGDALKHFLIQTTATG